jgi:hypothetical protein
LGAAELISAASALFSTTTQIGLTQEPSRSTANQDQIIDILDDHDVKIRRSNLELSTMNKTLWMVEQYMELSGNEMHASVLMGLCQSEYSLVRTHLDNLIMGLQSLVNHRLHQNLVPPTVLKRSLNRLIRRLAAIGYTAAVTNIGDLYRTPTSHTTYTEDNIIIAFVHVAIYRQDTILQLYKYVETPILFAGENYTRHFFLARPHGRERYLAINRQNDIFKELSDDEFRQCQRIDTLWFCNKDNILQRHPGTSCLTTIFKGKDPEHVCEIEIRSHSDFLAQTSDNNFRLFQPYPGAIEINCQGSHGRGTMSRKYQGLIDITIPPGCEGKSTAFRFSSRIQVSSEGFPVTLGLDQNIRLIPDQLDNNTVIRLFSKLKALDLKTVTTRHIKELYDLEPSGFWASYFPKTVMSLSTFNIVIIVVICGGLSYLYKQKHDEHKEKRKPPNIELNIINEQASPLNPEP